MNMHTFAICAYGNSPYLESCIRSLMAQTVPSKVIMCTSTPESEISALAEKYDIPVFINSEKNGIQSDWNFALSCADSPLATLAHQDDMYHRHYTEELLKAYRRYPDMTVFTTSSVTVKEDKAGKSTLIEWGKPELIKKFLRLPLRLTFLAHKAWIKAASLIFGNPVICPSCTYNLSVLKQPVFHSEFSYVLDWDTMTELALKPGRFVCCEKPLLYYRVHPNATSKLCIDNHIREDEEKQMFLKFWPQTVADILMYFYKKAYSAYEVKEKNE